MDILSKRPEMIPPFKLFGWAHIVTVFLMIIIGYIIIKKSKKDEKFSGFLKKKLIISLIFMDLSYRLWSGFYENNSLTGLFSVHISSMSVFLSIVVLIKFNQKIFDVLFYWALILVPQAIITPGIYRYGFPHLRFFHIFIIHFLVIYAVLYLIIIENKRLSQFSLKRALISTHLYGLFVFIINVIFDTNYMFIAKKSSLPSLIEYLGPWPYYIFVLDGLVIVLFMLLNKVYKKFLKIKNEEINKA